MTLARFASREAVASLDGDALCAAVTAAALLDQRAFSSLACCEGLVARPGDLRQALQSSDLTMGLVLATVFLRDPRGSQLLLPHLLAHIGEMAARWQHTRRSYRNQLLVVQRRVSLLGLCAAFGVPHRHSWPLTLLRMLQASLDELGRATSTRAKDAYEPTPSSFHLEVGAVLKLMSVKHQHEHPQPPFNLDIVIAQLDLQVLAS